MYIPRSIQYREESPHFKRIPIHH